MEPEPSEENRVYVCICHAVTDEQIERAVDTGADTVARIGEYTAAGTGCGMCHEQLEEIVESRCGSCPLVALVA